MDNGKAAVENTGSTLPAQQHLLRQVAVPTCNAVQGTVQYYYGISNSVKAVDKMQLHIAHSVYVSKQLPNYKIPSITSDS